VLVNAAAYTDTERAEIEPDAAQAVNADGAAVVAQCARKFGIPIIHISTDWVFDGTKAEPYVESDATAPLSAYGRSKVAGENAVGLAAPEHVILRTSWIYSADGSNFVLTMLKLAAQRDEIRVVADQIGNPTAAADIADGILTIAHSLVRDGGGDERYGIFHMSGTGTATWADLAAAVFALSAAAGGPAARVVPIKSSEYPSRVRRPRNSRLDCSKIAAVYGISLPPWQSSLADCIRRILEQRR
jgi:dTDP-4-dehydrorhamnose reductase